MDRRCQGAQTRDALHQLASNFDHLAVPEGGNTWRNPPPNERAVSFVSPEFQKQEAGLGRSRSFTRLLAIDPTGATARLAPCRSALVVPAGDEFRLRGAAPSRCGNTRPSGRFVSVAWWISPPSVPWLGDEVPVAMRQSSQSGGRPQGTLNARRVRYSRLADIMLASCTAETIFMKDLESYLLSCLIGIGGIINQR